MKEFDLRNYLYNNPLTEKKKHDTKKGNLEMQKKMEGAIRDNRDHKFDIDKEENEQRKKLAKLKKDAKKESGKGKKGNKDEQKRAEGAIADAKRHKKALDGDIKADEKKLAKLKKDYKKDINEGCGYKKEKLTKEGLRDLIKEKITTILREVDSVEDTEDVDVEDTEDVDIEKTTDVDITDTEEEDIAIDDEETETETTIKTVTPGIEDENLAELDGLLTKSLEVASRYGNKNLTTQVSNTKIMADRITAKAMSGIE